MLSVMFAAILVDRPALTMRSVALAAAIILLSQPESLIQPGFEMSFAAVTGLIALAEWEAARRARNPDAYVARGVFGRARRYLFGIALASIVAGLATAPFAIFHFDRASQYGLLANVLAMPVVGLLVMPAATAAMLLMPFGLDKWALIAMGKGVGLMLAIAHWVAGLPGAATMVAVWPQAALIAHRVGRAVDRAVARTLALAGRGAGLRRPCHRRPVHRPRTFSSRATAAMWRCGWAMGGWRCCIRPKTIMPPRAGSSAMAMRGASMGLSQCRAMACAATAMAAWRICRTAWCWRSRRASMRCIPIARRPTSSSAPCRRASSAAVRAWSSTASMSRAMAPMRSGFGDPMGIETVRGRARPSALERISGVALADVQEKIMAAGVADQ